MQRIPNPPLPWTDERRGEAGDKKESNATLFARPNGGDRDCEDAPNESGTKIPQITDRQRLVRALSPFDALLNPSPP